MFLVRPHKPFSLLFSFQVIRQIPQPEIFFLRKTVQQNDLDRKIISDDIINPFLRFSYLILPLFCQMPDQFPGILMTCKCQCQFLHRDAVCRSDVRFIKAGISVYFVEIIHVQRIFRTFVFYDIVFPEDPAYIFPYPLSSFFFDDQKIDLLRFSPKLMFSVKRQIFTLLFQFDLHSRTECRMPLEELFGDCSFP